MAKARARKATKTAGSRKTEKRGAARTAAAGRKTAPTKKARSSSRTASKRGGAKQSTRSQAGRAKALPRKRTPSVRSRVGAAAEAVGVAVRGTIAAAAARAPWSSGGTDAIELLERDHRRLEGLLARGEDTTPRAVKGRTALLETIVQELNAHEMIEEKILYPALKSHPEARDIVLEGYQEHHVADLIVKELQALRRSDERWGAKFKVLKENLEHHIEEEEGEMFRTARAVLSREELEQLGAAMQQMKQRGR